MSIAITQSYSLVGVNAVPIQIEVHLSNGLPGLNIVGLPEGAVRESKDRVRSALLNSGFDYPARRMTINLAPANLPKTGSAFDLPIAIGILIASKQLQPIQDMSKLSFVGELSLSGQVRNISGALPIAIQSQNDQRFIYTSVENLAELDILQHKTFQGTPNLAALCSHLSGISKLAANSILLDKAATPKPKPKLTQNHICLSDVQGQPHAKRALTICAAGAHSIYMQGPPGTGKTMLASRLPSIFPALEEKHMIEVASIYSVAQQTRRSILDVPFRTPHHTVSPVALVGGGGKPIPGEISLAHKGILFLDELPEFPAKVLDVLRQPLESGEIHISRASGKVSFPCQFILVAAGNPCPCGYFNESKCQCTPDKINNYRNKVSGPIKDRIDLHLPINRQQQHLNANTSDEQTSAQIRELVIRCRQRQLSRQQCLNSELRAEQIQKILEDNDELLAQAQMALDKLDLSMRAIHRAIRVALTIADLAEQALDKAHFLEALSFRQK